MATAFLRDVVASCFEYNTPRIAHIKDTTIGATNRCIQFLIIGYIIGYAIVYKKGYQDVDNVKSAVTTKVKGIEYFSDSRYGNGTLDVADYVIPPQETDAFFVMTGFIKTALQNQSTCPESPYIKAALCDSDSQCEMFKGTILPKGNGPVTGRCVPSSIRGQPNVCEIFGWCPVEDDNLDQVMALYDILNFTVFIKNNIEFPKFGVSKRNILDIYHSDSELSDCLWNDNDERSKFCPIFLLEDILKEVGANYTALLQMGGLIKIVIDWTCDLDNSVDDCLPQYSFIQLDKGDYTSSVGFNFRYADHFYEKISGTNIFFRNLYKVYGIHFLIEVRGQAGKFGIVPLLLNIGSGLALLGIATILCDIIVLYLLKAKEFYREVKYLDVTGEDAFLGPRKDSSDVPSTSGRTYKRHSRQELTGDGDDSTA
ncbi:hypothetical protein BsWGS_08509 [Bradybaena similaris]